MEALLVAHKPNGQASVLRRGCLRVPPITYGYLLTVEIPLHRQNFQSLICNACSGCFQLEFCTRAVTRPGMHSTAGPWKEVQSAELYGRYPGACTRISLRAGTSACLHTRVLDSSLRLSSWQDKTARVRERNEVGFDSPSTGLLILEYISGYTGTDQVSCGRRLGTKRRKLAVC